MTYKRKTVSFKKEDFEQFIIYLDQVIETIDTLKERKEKNFKLNDFLQALEIHSKILIKYQKKLFKKYKLDYIMTLKNLENFIIKFQRFP